MSDPFKDLFAEMAKNVDPEYMAFSERAMKEDAVDLYVEYYNKAEEARFYKGPSDAETRKLEVMVKQCEMVIIMRALEARGYTATITTRYKKKP